MCVLKHCYLANKPSLRLPGGFLNPSEPSSPSLGFYKHTHTHKQMESHITAVCMFWWDCMSAVYLCVCLLQKLISQIFSYIMYAYSILSLSRLALRDVLEDLSEEMWWQFCKMTNAFDCSFTMSLTYNSELFWRHFTFYPHSRNLEWLNVQILSQWVLIWKRPCSPSVWNG